MTLTYSTGRANTEQVTELAAVDTDSMTAILCNLLQHRMAVVTIINLARVIELRLIRSLHQHKSLMAWGQVSTACKIDIEAARTNGYSSRDCVWMRRKLLSQVTKFTETPAYVGRVKHLQTSEIDVVQRSTVRWTCGGYKF
jgi:hypothetical protein